MPFLYIIGCITCILQFYLFCGSIVRAYSNVSDLNSINKFLNAKFKEG